MIRVKQTGVPQTGAHWSYGPDYMRRISRQSARALCGMYPLPDICREIVVAIARDALIGSRRLYVQNVSGVFHVASADAKVSDWPEVFGVEMIE